MKKDIELSKEEMQKRIMELETYNDELTIYNNQLLNTLDELIGENKQLKKALDNSISIRA